MTKQVSKNKCKHCVHFPNGYCTLQDLETCRFKDIDPDRKAENIFLGLVTAIGIVTIILSILYL